MKSHCGDRTRVHPFFFSSSVGYGWPGFKLYISHHSTYTHNKLFDCKSHCDVGNNNIYIKRTNTPHNTQKSCVWNKENPKDKKKTIVAVRCGGGGAKNNTNSSFRFKILIYATHTHMRGINIYIYEEKKTFWISHHFQSVVLWI